MTDPKPITPADLERFKQASAAAKAAPMGSDEAITLRCIQAREWDALIAAHEQLREVASRVRDAYVQDNTVHRLDGVLVSHEDWDRLTSAIARVDEALGDDESGKETLHAD